MIPDKIYSVIILDDSIPGNTRGAWSCVEVDGALNTEYIRKDALLEWLNERYKTTISNVGCYTGHSVWAEVIDKINEM